MKSAVQRIGVTLLLTAAGRASRLEAAAASPRSRASPRPRRPAAREGSRRGFVSGVKFV